MPRSSKFKRVTRSISALFGHTTANVTRLNQKDRYYHAFYLPRNLCEGIELIAQIERTSDKAAAELLVSRGISAYMAEKLEEQTRLEKEARDQARPLKDNRFWYLVREYASEKGVKIGKLF